MQTQDFRSHVSAFRFIIDSRPTPLPKVLQFQIFLHGEGIHSTAVQLEYHSLDVGRMSPVQSEGCSHPCRLRCPKIQKGGHEGGSMWVDCDTGRCCDDTGRTR